MCKINSFVLMAIFASILSFSTFIIKSESNNSTSNSVFDDIERFAKEIEQD